MAATTQFIALSTPCCFDSTPHHTTHRKSSVQGGNPKYTTAHTHVNVAAIHPACIDLAPCVPVCLALSIQTDPKSKNARTHTQSRGSDREEHTGDQDSSSSAAARALTHTSHCKGWKGCSCPCKTDTQHLPSNAITTSDLPPLCTSPAMTTCNGSIPVQEHRSPQASPTTATTHSHHQHPTHTTDNQPLQTPLLIGQACHSDRSTQHVHSCHRPADPAAADTNSHTHVAHSQHRRM